MRSRVSLVRCVADGKLMGDHEATTLSQAIKAADRVEALLSGDTNPIPTLDVAQPGKLDPITVATHHAYTLGMYARARSYFRAVILLVKHGRPVEALSLGRSLFEDSLRLVILASLDEPRQVDCLVGWLLDGLRRAEGLDRTAAALGIADQSQHAAMLEFLEMERGKILRYRSRKGSGEPTPNTFTKDRFKQAALGADRSGAWLLREMGDQIVHGNYFAHVLQHTPSDDGTALIAIEQRDPRALLDTLAYAVESVVVSHQSICAILGLDTMPELDQLVLDLETLQNEATDTA